jgi:ribose transport system ATP-binding protein
LVSSLSVAENIFIGVRRKGDRLYHRKKNGQEAAKILESFDIYIDPNTVISKLSAAQKQLIEIVRAISRDVKVLILDEPTSSLTVHETQFLFKTVRRLREHGVTIIYISHIFEETFALSDRVTVMRDGRYIATKNTSEIDRAELVSMMVGHEMKETFSERAAKPGKTVLNVEHVSGEGVDDVSFELREQEILGFAGLVGAGRSELMNAIYGATKMTAGTVEIDGKTVRNATPRKAIQNGFGLIPEDRKLQGVFLSLNVRDNISSANLRNLSHYSVVDDKKATRQANDFVERLRIRTPSLLQIVRNLSGGNQQKVAVAKALAPAPRILIFDEPTRGIDVGAKQEIYKLMNQMVEAGSSIIMISSEMVELMGMADRIIILAEHKKAGELQRHEYSQEAILDIASM